MTYRIIDWDNLFENNRSRNIRDLNWVPVPNSFDGEGFALVMAHEKAAQIYTAWQLILQIASKCPKRGILANGKGKPYSARTLAIKCRGQVEWFEAALEYLSSDEIGWIETIEDDVAAAIMAEETTSQTQATDAGVTSETSGERQAGDVQNVSRESASHGRAEGKGREGNRRGGIEGECEGKDEPAIAEPSKPTPKQLKEKIPPDPELANEYAASLGMSQTETNKWRDHYDSNGWRVGRNPMKDWRASMRNWHSGRFVQGTPPGRAPTPGSDFETYEVLR